MAASPPSLLQHCFREAASAARDALARCIDGVVAELQLAEHKSPSIADRDAAADAWRGLQQHKAGCCERFAVQLLASFENAGQPAAPPSTPRAPAGELTLVDDTELARAIESSRLLQRVLPTVEQPLSRLDALVSAAQGLPAVSPERNPFRPEQIVQVLQAVLGEASVEPPVRATWLRHLTEPFGRELAALYALLATRLETAHVQAAGYRVLATVSSTRAGTPRDSGAAPVADGAAPSRRRGPEAPPPHGQPDTEAPVAPDGVPYADLAGYEIGDALFQDFLDHGGSLAQHRLAPSYYVAVESQLAQLRAQPETHDPAPPDTAEPTDPDLAPQDRPVRALGVGSQLNPERWGPYSRARERSLVRTGLKKDATRVGQVLGLELVRKIVDQVAQDPRLLTPVREAIVALEPSLLRLAMVDPRFLHDEQHPGRLLMERVAQRSLRYEDPAAPGFPEFFEPVRAGFNALNAQEAIADPQPFAAALASLEGLWSAEDAHDDAPREQAVQAVRLAEQRQALADQIAYDLSQRTDLDRVPAAVLDFLYGPWSLAMAQARLNDTRQQIDPGGYGVLVSELVWSSKVEFTLQQPAKLITMIPGLLRQLREGLDLLGQDPAERDAFFTALEQLHRPVLELRRASRERIAEATAALMADPAVQPATPEQRVARPAAQPWLAPREQGAAGFEPDTPATAPVQGADDGLAEQLQALAGMTGTALPATAQADVAEDTEADDGTAAILHALHVGSWVDLKVGRRWRRARLVWCSANGALYMFESRGGRPHSMTRRSCERLLREGQLRPVHGGGVVAQALQSLRAAAKA